MSTGLLLLTAFIYNALPLANYWQTCSDLLVQVATAKLATVDAGFSSKQAYKMGIPAIGIVAVLVANVAFVGWVQTPGAAAVPCTSIVQCGHADLEGVLIAGGSHIATSAFAWVLQWCLSLATLYVPVLIVELVAIL